MAFTYLQPGVPCIYYGDEYGIDGGEDPECRKCMIWDKSKQDLSLYAFFKNLVSLRRKNNDILSKGSINWNDTLVDKNLVIFKRSLNGREITGVFNNSNSVQKVDFEGTVKMDNLVSFAEEKVTISPKGFIIFSK